MISAFRIFHWKIGQHEGTLCVLTGILFIRYDDGRFSAARIRNDECVAIAIYDDAGGLAFFPSAVVVGAFGALGSAVNAALSWPSIKPEQTSVIASPTNRICVFLLFI